MGDFILNKNTKIQDVHLTIRISSRLLEQFQNIVNETSNLTVSEVVRALMVKYIKDAWKIRKKQNKAKSKVNGD